MSNSTLPARNLIKAYQDGTLNSVTNNEIIELIEALIVQNIRVYKQAKTIKRLELDVADLSRVRDSLKHWHKVSDDARELRKRVQMLESQLRDSNMG